MEELAVLPPQQQKQKQRQEEQHSFDSLPDDVLLIIARWTATFDSRDFLCLSRTCLRMRKLLLDDPQTIYQIICIDLRAPPSITNLEHLAFYHIIQQAGLLEENRIGFDYASTDIDFRNAVHPNDDYDDDEDNYPAEQLLGHVVVGSRARLSAVRYLLRRFSDCRIVVEAHCGTLAPRGIAPLFSRMRGMTVCGELLEGEEENAAASAAEHSPVSDRIVLNAWGQAVAVTAAVSTHAYGNLAREGKGWVELYLKLGDLELPPRPDFWPPAIASLQRQRQERRQQRQAREYQEESDNEDDSG